MGRDRRLVGDETVDLEDAAREAPAGRRRRSSTARTSRRTSSRLESHYTDRGFYFAKVEPRTRLDPETTRRVDVQFHVEKGPLYFVRRTSTSPGNTRTVDPVDASRDEASSRGSSTRPGRSRSSAGSARATSASSRTSPSSRSTTEDPSLLDLDVSGRRAARPARSASAAGFSSQDQPRAHGLAGAGEPVRARLCGVNLSADIGGRTNRFFFSIQRPVLPELGRSGSGPRPSS